MTNNYTLGVEYETLMAELSIHLYREFAFLFRIL